MTRIEELREEIKNLKNKMSTLAEYAMPCESVNEEKREEYYKVLKSFQSKRAELNTLLDEERKNKKDEPEQEKTFVNSYGEATKREITNSTYKRSQKRLERDVLRNLGRRK